MAIRAETSGQGRGEAHLDPEPTVAVVEALKKNPFQIALAHTRHAGHETVPFLKERKRSLPRCACFLDKRVGVMQEVFRGRVSHSDKVPVPARFANRSPKPLSAAG